MSSPPSCRPSYHYTASEGWLNDTNGLLYHDGEYHLFYQFASGLNGRIAENMHWGHAVSRDLVRWEELPVALQPHPDFGQAGLAAP